MCIDADELQTIQLTIDATVCASARVDESCDINICTPGWYRKPDKEIQPNMTNPGIDDCCIQAKDTEAECSAVRRRYTTSARRRDGGEAITCDECPFGKYDAGDFDDCFCTGSITITHNAVLDTDAKYNYVEPGSDMEFGVTGLDTLRVGDNVTIMK